MKKSFESTGNKGFHLTFKNGIVLSTQYGPGNYSDNYDHEFIDMKNKPGFKANNVEVAMFEIDGNWKTKEIWKEVFNEDLNDDVVANVDMDKWLKVVAYLSKGDK